MPENDLKKLTHQVTKIVNETPIADIHTYSLLKAVQMLHSSLWIPAHQLP